MRRLRRRDSVWPCSSALFLFCLLPGAAAAPLHPQLSALFSAASVRAQIADGPMRFAAPAAGETGPVLEGLLRAAPVQPVDLEGAVLAAEAVSRSS